MVKASAELAAMALTLAGAAGFLAGRAWGRGGYSFNLAAAAAFCLSLFLFFCAAFTE